MMKKSIALFVGVMCALTFAPHTLAAPETLTGSLVDLAYYSMNKAQIGNAHIYGIAGAVGHINATGIRR